MTIVIDNGEWWIEFINFSIPFVAVSTDTDGTLVNFERQGHVMAWGIINNFVLTEEVIVSAKNELSQTLNVGRMCTGIIPVGRITNAAAAVPVTRGFFGWFLLRR